jgi:hypothetical protein
MVEEALEDLLDKQGDIVEAKKDLRVVMVVMGWLSLDKVFCYFHVLH